MSKLITIFLTGLLVVTLAGTLSGCPGKLAPTPPQTSAISTSEIAEAVASGVANATYSSGSMARYIPHSPRAVALSKIIESYLSPIPRAEAALTSGLCSTVQSGSVGVLALNAACTIVNNIANQANIESLTWPPCNGATPLGTWSGGTNFSLVNASSTIMTCSGFTPFQAGDIVTRTFFAPTGRINNASLDPSNNVPWNPLTQTDMLPPNNVVTVLVDTYGGTLVPNNTNYNSITSGAQALPSNYSPSAFSGYFQPIPTLGETITFLSPTNRNIMVNGIHLKADVAGYIVWDFMVSSTFNGGGTFLTVNGANLSGDLFVQDNINKVTTDSTFAGITYTAGCGVPNGGTVTTTKVQGPGSFTTETLTFPPGICGTGSINGGSNFYLFHSF